jgi:hypothetical protein
MIEPELICLTARGFKLPFFITGVLAWARYEFVDRMALGEESSFRGTWCRML